MVSILESIKCNPTEFTCANKRCIYSNLVCNSIDDCQDGSDELNCPTCKEDEFFCDADTKCISKTKVCDEKLDCSDGADELDCILSCLPSEFYCGLGECISSVSI